MARQEPARSQSAGEPPNLKVKVKLDAQGRWRAVSEPRETTEVTEPAERPPTPDDPRPAAFRNIPPFGGAL
ncbi:MAG TPA: hypothetical protein VNS09_21125 [Solirubrobacter sp.]|nr:hypothetical protein [Solirubrobacter sp.]